MLTDCGEYRPRLIELARGAMLQEDRRELMAHVESCADCARVLDEQLTLSATLGSLAGEELPEMAEIEQRVLAEFDRAMGWRRRFRLPVMVPIAACLAAAALLAAVVMTDRRTPAIPREATPKVVAVETSAPVELPVVHPRSTPIAKVRHVATQPKAMPESQPFLPIPYTVPLAREEQVTVVPMQVPVAALIAAGFQIATTDPGAVLDADVLVSQDGRARAIRLNSK